MAEWRSAAERQTELLRFILGYSGEHGYPPTVREMASAVGLSASVAHHYLIMLERQGRIRRVAGSARTVVVVPPESAE